MTDYYVYQSNTSVIITNNCANIPIEHTSGTLKIGISNLDDAIFQFVMLQVLDEEGNILATSDTSLKIMCYEEALIARWIRLDKPPVISNQALFMHLESKDPYKDKMKNNRVDIGKLKIRAAIFPTETHRWREFDYSWIFVCSLKRYN